MHFVCLSEISLKIVYENHYCKYFFFNINLWFGEQIFKRFLNTNLHKELKSEQNELFNNLDKTS